MSLRLRVIHFLVILAFVSAFPLSAQTIPTPESHLGFKVGADYKLAGWEQITEYFNILGESSDKILVEEIGKTTEGNPFIQAIISSSENMQNLDNYKNIAKKLAGGRISKEEARRLSEKGKSVLLITCSMHATEVGASQMSMELAYNLLTGDSPEIRRILDNVIIVLVPSFNPDGLNMVRDWYYKNLETPFEASSLPYLYHKYTGHDNNRDAYMLTQVESRLVTKMLYKEWFPQAYLDMHQMGNRGPRMFVPPFIDPPNDNVNPIVWRWTDLLGTTMAADLQDNGCSGVISDALFTGWWQGAFGMTAFPHNCMFILTELASVNIASPIFQKKSELQGKGRGMRGYTKTMNFPDPWKGGWWRLRDIIDYDLISAMSLLEAFAQHREKLLYNIWNMGNQAINKGKSEPPYAFVLPQKQWDKPTMMYLLDLLMQNGAEIHQAKSKFTADGIEYPKNTYVILLSQPYRNFIKDLLEPQQYPDMRQYPGGPPIAPYDIAGWTLPYQMGVNVKEVITPLEGDFVKFDKVVSPPGKVAPQGKSGYILDYKANNSVIAVNRLLKENYSVYFSGENVKIGQKKYPGGTIIIPQKQGLHNKLQALAKELSIDFTGISSSPKCSGYRLKKPKIGLYKPWSASMSEGWNRWVLEQYEFDFKNLSNAEVKAGELIDRYSAIYIPDIGPKGIIEGRPKGSVPPAYADGIGKDGLRNLKEFVQKGGTLVLLDSACDLIIGEFGLPVANTLKGVKSEDFFCPGSILNIEVDNTHPVAFGVPDEASAFFARSPAFKIIPSFTIDADVVAKYPGKNPLKSGWIIGEKNIFNKAAVVHIPYEKGHIILIGFKVIQRAQSCGTFKILFNSLYLSASTKARLP